MVKIPYLDAIHSTESFTLDQLVDLLEIQLTFRALKSFFDEPSGFSRGRQRGACSLIFLPGFKKLH